MTLLKTRLLKTLRRARPTVPTWRPPRRHRAASLPTEGRPPARKRLAGARSRGRVCRPPHLPERPGTIARDPLPMPGGVLPRGLRRPEPTTWAFTPSPHSLSFTGSCLQPARRLPTPRPERTPLAQHSARPPQKDPRPAPRTPISNPAGGWNPIDRSQNSYLCVLSKLQHRKERAGGGGITGHGVSPEVYA